MIARVTSAAIEFRLCLHSGGGACRGLRGGKGCGQGPLVGRRHPAHKAGKMAGKREQSERANCGASGRHHYTIFILWSTTTTVYCVHIHTHPALARPRPPSPSLLFTARALLPFAENQETGLNSRPIDRRISGQAVAGRGRRSHHFGPAPPCIASTFLVPVIGQARSYSSRMRYARASRAHPLLSILLPEGRWA